MGRLAFGQAFDTNTAVRQTLSTAQRIVFAGAMPTRVDEVDGVAVDVAVAVGRRGVGADAQAGGGVAGQGEVGLGHVAVPGL